MIKMLKERFTGLLAKLFSLKTIVFVIATVLYVCAELPWYAWLIAAAMFLGLRYMEKLGGLGNFGK